MSKVFVVFLMVFLHILDDYFLQSMILGELKQKSFWEKNAPDEMYKDDYLAALFMHSFSWAFMIMLPIAISQKFTVGILFIIALAINWLIHFVVDNAKANKHKLNLIQDQTIHLAQIFVTYIAWLLFGF